MKENKYKKNLNKEQLSLGDYSIPRSLNECKYSISAHKVIILFLKENESDLLFKDTNDKVFSREYLDFRKKELYDDALFFIHHENKTLNKYFSYDFHDEYFIKLYKHMKKYGFYVNFIENKTSGIFRGFGIKQEI